MNKPHGWVRGKVLGGSSAVNFNMFSMASKQDLDNWAELGNKGWSFNDLIPYYKKFETYHPASETLAEMINDKYLDKSLRGTSGPIQVRYLVVSTHTHTHTDSHRSASQIPTSTGLKMCGLK